VARDPGLIREGDFTEPSGYRQALDLLAQSPPPTALFAANHMILVGCIRAAREMGLRVPEDVEIAGFEGFRDSGFDHLVSTPLTVNEHPTREMAVAAVDLLLEDIRARRQGKKAVFRKVVLKTRLAQASAGALRTGA
jgi:DNA-binding LacI/PurR family transcriptional regulator